MFSCCIICLKWVEEMSPNRGTSVNFKGPLTLLNAIQLESLKRVGLPTTPRDSPTMACSVSTKNTCSWINTRSLRNTQIYKLFLSELKFILHDSLQQHQLQHLRYLDRFSYSEKTFELTSIHIINISYNKYIIYIYLYIFIFIYIYISIYLYIV